MIKLTQHIRRSTTATAKKVIRSGFMVNSILGQFDHSQLAPLIGQFDPWSIRTSIHRRLTLGPKIIKNI